MASFVISHQWWWLKVDISDSLTNTEVRVVVMVRVVVSVRVVVMPMTVSVVAIADNGRSSIAPAAI